MPLFSLIQDLCGTLDDFGEGSLGAKADGGHQFLNHGFSTAHIVESWRIGSIVGNELKGGAGMKDFDDGFGQAANSDFFGAANIENVSAGLWAVLEPEQRFDGVGDETKAARLESITVNAKGLAFFGRADEAGQDHAEAASLPGANGIEEARNHYRQRLFFRVGQGQELVH